MVVPLRRQLDHGLVDALDDDRRQTERDLVQQHEPGVGHERAADGQRLLLAAGEAGRLALDQRLEQREELETDSRFQSPLRPP